MRIFVLLTALLFICNCAYFKNRPETVARTPQSVKKPKREKRMNKQEFEDTSLLGERVGSLWVSRGQSSYYFANNNLRLIGDLINIKIEGYPKDQIQTKANVISKLLADILNEEQAEIKSMQDELNKQYPVENRGPASEKSLADMNRKEKEQYFANLDVANEKRKRNEKRLDLIGDEQGKIEKLRSGQEFPIDSVPTRIVSILKNGNYKIEGMQPFMIGRREYRLLVSGMIKPADFGEEGMSAELLLDPTFDILSHKTKRIKQ